MPHPSLQLSPLYISTYEAHAVTTHTALVIGIAYLDRRGPGSAPRPRDAVACRVRAPRVLMYGGSARIFESGRI